MAGHEFQYPVLQDPAVDFRLLEILSGDSEKTIECKMTVHKRSCAPTYAAVSYEWGAEPAEFAIHLNGNSFPVRPNLWQCLKQLRSHRYVQHYWVDAICIDQADLRERSAQTSAMGSIYSNAKFVTAWIGDTEEDSNLSSTNAIFFLNEHSQTWEALYRNDPEKSKAMSLAIALLLHRSYWRRLWIIQEIMLARGVRILCGKDVLEWSQLHAFFRFLQDRDSEIRNHYHSRTSGLPDEEYSKIRDDYHKQEFPHREVLASDASKFFISGDEQSPDRTIHSSRMPKFITLVERHHGSTLCYDLRDKIFGLLGLDPEMKDFAPNYHNSPWEVYVRVLIYLQERYPLMPALFVSQVLQKALLIQSHERPAYEAIRSLVFAGGEDMIFRDVVRTVGMVQRVGAAPATNAKPSLEDLETIMHSLGLQWTTADRSFSARDFSGSQQSMLATLATREDMIASSTFNHSACSATVLPSKPSDLPTGFRKDLRERPQDNHKSNRFFLTTDRVVGLGGASVAPGDIICQAFERNAPMFVIRKPDTHEESYILVGRCYAWHFADDHEKGMARKHKGVDLSNIIDGEVSDTYWAPQVTSYQPVWEGRTSNEGDYKLHFDLETLAVMSALPEYWICASNETWYRERTGDNRSCRDFTGRLDRIRVVVATSLLMNEDVPAYPVEML